MCFLFGYWFMDYSQNVTSPELIWLAGKIHHEWVDVFPIGKWEFSHADVSELGGSKSDLTPPQKKRCCLQRSTSGWTVAAFGNPANSPVEVGN